MIAFPRRRHQPPLDHERFPSIVIPTDVHLTKPAQLRQVRGLVESIARTIYIHNGVTGGHEDALQKLVSTVFRERGWDGP